VDDCGIGHRHGPNISARQRISQVFTHHFRNISVSASESVFTPGGEMLAMADEGLGLAARSGARLNQAQSAASHTASHLQVVGFGEWSPRSTNPSWADDPRVAGDET
jgi:hypothetical protein